MLIMRTTLNIVFSVTSSICVCSRLIVNYACSVTNTKCKPNIILSLLIRKKWALYIYSVAIIVTY